MVRLRELFTSGQAHGARKLTRADVLLLFDPQCTRFCGHLCQVVQQST